MGEFLNKQLEWLKSFFAEDTAGGPSHKNLIGISLGIVFCIAFLKKTMGAADIPDIPAGWQLVLLGMLGISNLGDLLKLRKGNGTTDTTTTIDTTSNTSSTTTNTGSTGSTDTTKQGV